MRECRTCGETKSTDEFPKHGAGFRPDCKVCFYSKQKTDRAEGHGPPRINEQADRLVRLKPRKSKRTLHGAGTPNHPKRLVVARRNAQIVEMRIRGAKLSDIGKQFGLANATVCKAIQDTLASVIVPAVDEYRKIQDLRLDVALAALWPAVEEGDVDSVNAFLRIEDMRAKLWGTYHRETSQDISGRPIIPIDLFRQMGEDAARARQKLAEVRELPAPTPVSKDDIDHDISDYFEGQAVRVREMDGTDSNTTDE